MSMRTNAVLFLLLGSSLSACAGDITDGGGAGNGDVGDNAELVAADDSVNPGISFAGAFTVGQLVRVCNASALNQRSGAGATYSILRSMPEGSTTKILESQGTWYRNDWGGKLGWSSGAYLCAIDGGGGTEPAATFDVSAITRDSFISIAKAATGFSYYWGGGRFAGGASHGACYGSCPNCDHEGSYGADCSGFIGKAWLLPASLPMDSNKHPYSTSSFYNEHTTWHDVARSNVLRGDALVYRSGSSGHIVMYEKDDPWGSFWTYEARGCSYGVVHNIRTASSSYKGIRRDGL